MAVDEYWIQRARLSCDSPDVESIISEYIQLTNDGSPYAYYYEDAITMIATGSSIDSAKKYLKHIKKKRSSNK